MRKMLIAWLASVSLTMHAQMNHYAFSANYASFVPYADASMGLGLKLDFNKSSIPLYINVNSFLNAKLKSNRVMLPKPSSGVSNSFTLGYTQRVSMHNVQVGSQFFFNHLRKQTGTYLSSLLSANIFNYSYSPSVVLDTSIYENKYNTAINKFKMSIGVQLGLGYQFALKNAHKVFAEIYLNYVSPGLGKKGNAIGIEPTRSSSFAGISVGYRIPLGKDARDEE